MRTGTVKCRLFSAMLLLATFAGPGAPAGAGEATAHSGYREIVLATVASSINDAETQLLPVIDAANRSLVHDHLKLRLHVFGTYTSLIWQMWDEKIDLVIDDTYTALNIMRDTAGHPLGALTRPGGALTRSVIVALSSSDIHHLDDLVGHTLAFSKPASSFGHLLPRLSLGLDSYGMLEAPGGSHPRRQPGVISMVFTHDALSPIIWLHKNRVDAAAVPEHLLDHFEWNLPGRFRRIAVSSTSPQQLVIHRAGFDTEIAQKLETALAGAFATRNGRYGDWLTLTPAQATEFQRLIAAIAGLDGS